MLPPPPSHCAFASACKSRPGGQKSGPDICRWCKNMSFKALQDRAKSKPNEQDLKSLIAAHKSELSKESQERASKGWPPLCACKHPDFCDQEWRSAFHPNNSRLCGTVRHHGQLCARCYDSAKEQNCAWLVQFNGDQFHGDQPGFPCIFEDDSLKNVKDRNWRTGPRDADGHPNPDWEMDPTKHGSCIRSDREKQLCQKCFNRMCEIKHFGKYFDTEWGTLLSTLGL